MVGISSIKEVKLNILPKDTQTGNVYYTEYHYKTFVKIIE